jgi:hypothetical protein
MSSTGTLVCRHSPDSRRSIANLAVLARQVDTLPLKLRPAMINDPDLADAVAQLFGLPRATPDMRTRILFYAKQEPRPPMGLGEERAPVIGLAETGAPPAFRSKIKTPPSSLAQGRR